MLNKKLNHQQWRKYRLIISIALTIVLFLIVYYVIPTSISEAVGDRKIIKSAFISVIFGFLPFYIIPWLKWVMGHENDWENMDGEPVDKEENKA
ncbi:MAG TPA: hypothetical protein PK209_12910 [Saprospiraceae bacterium]|nr:hypothetical protein [Saprospiraceae bacterium]